QALKLPVDGDAIRNSMATLSASLQNEISGAARAAITNMPNYLLQFLVMLMTLFIVLLRYRKIRLGVTNISAVSRERMMQIDRILSEVCHDVVIANIITGFVQASLVATGAFFATDFDPVVI